MITKIDFDMEVIFETPPTTEFRRKTMCKRQRQEARKRLLEQGAKKGETWDFTTKTVETRKNNSIVCKYTDKFLLTI